MKLKRILISFFLLFVYSISFAHSLSYHEHGFYTEHQYEFIDVDNDSHSHAHQSHSEELSTDGAHINHNNHCDVGVLDLIACVLSDLTGHQHEDCEFESEKNSESKRLTNQNNGKLLASFIIVSIHSNDYFLELKPLINRLNIDFQCLLIDSTPLRGPPITC